MKIANCDEKNPTLTRGGWKALAVAAISLSAVAGPNLGAVREAVPATSSTKIHSCIANSNGLARIVETTAKCGSSASPLAWNVRGLTFRGAWNTSTVYKVNDLVGYEGSTWIATSAGSDATPGNSTQWNPFASKGKQGPAGNTGAPGNKGELGPTAPVTIQSGFHDGAVAVGLSSSLIPLVAMTIQHPGSYVVFAKFTAYDIQNSSDDFQCDLETGSDSDESWSGEFPTNPDYRSIILNVVHTFTAQDDKVVLACDDWSDNTTGYVRNIKITAISVNTLLNAYTSK